jgi:hypothetical protein
MDAALVGAAWLVKITSWFISRILERRLVNQLLFCLLGKGTIFSFLVWVHVGGFMCLCVPLLSEYVYGG